MKKATRCWDCSVNTIVVAKKYRFKISKSKRAYHQPPLVVHKRVRPKLKHTAVANMTRPILRDNARYSG